MRETNLDDAGVSHRRGLAPKGSLANCLGILKDMAVYHEQW